MKFTRKDAANILDLAEAQTCGTPQECQIADRIRAAISPEAWTRIERLGGLDKAADKAAEEYPDLV